MLRAALLLSAIATASALIPEPKWKAGRVPPAAQEAAMHLVWGANNVTSMIGVERRRARCTFNYEALCVAHGCHWCEGRCARAGEVDCAKEAAGEAAFRAELQQIFGAETSTAQRGVRTQSGTIPDPFAFYHLMFPAATPSPPPGCNNKCKVVKKACKLLLSGNAESICLKVAPYITNYDTWKAIKNDALDLWDLFKSGDLSLSQVFDFVMGVADRLGGVDTLGSLYTTLNSWLDYAENIISQILAAIGKVIDAAATSLLSMQMAVLKMSGGGADCYTCKEEFEIVVQLLDLDDPCDKTLLMGAYGAMNAYWAANPIWTASSGLEMVDANVCMTYNTFYCTQGITCEDFL